MKGYGVGIGRNNCFVCFARKAQHGAELKAGYEALLMLIHNEAGIVDSEQDSSLVHVKIENELYAMTHFEALFEIFLDVSMCLLFLADSAVDQNKAIDLRSKKGKGANQANSLSV